MIFLNALELLRRHASLHFGWYEVVVGYDFGILSTREIQDWVRSTALLGPEGEKLAGLEGADLICFEASLWAACVEATGTRVLRPGHQCWALAQDLWRTSLLKEALAWPLDDLEFGEAIESPDDMLGLLKRGYAWAKQPALADRAVVAAFVRNLETLFLAQKRAWIALAAS